MESPQSIRSEMARTDAPAGSRFNSPSATADRATAPRHNGEPIVAVHLAPYLVTAGGGHVVQLGSAAPHVVQLPRARMAGNELPLAVAHGAVALVLEEDGTVAGHASPASNDSRLRLPPGSPGAPRGVPVAGCRRPPAASGGSRSRVPAGARSRHQRRGDPALVNSVLEQAKRGIRSVRPRQLVLRKVQGPPVSGFCVL